MAKTIVLRATNVFRPRRSSPDQWTAGNRAPPGHRVSALLHVGDAPDARVHRHAGRDWKPATAWCALAALGDGVIVVGLFVLGRLVFGTPRWFVPPRIGRYAAVVAVGSVTQGVIERIALGLGLLGLRGRPADDLWRRNHRHHADGPFAPTHVLAARPMGTRSGPEARSDVTRRAAGTTGTRVEAGLRESAACGIVPPLRY